MKLQSQVEQQEITCSLVYRPSQAPSPSSSSSSTHYTRSDNTNIIIDNAADLAAPSTVVATGKRLLLVEDDWTSAQVALTFARNNGYTCNHAKDGVEAVEMFRDAVGDETTSYHIVLMDVMMPNMDGFEATTAIREIEIEYEMNAVPIVGLTADTQPKTTNRW